LGRGPGGARDGRAQEQGALVAGGGGGVGTGEADGDEVGAGRNV